MPLQSTSSTVSVLALLDHLERLESRLLTWGVIDGYFARDELEFIIDSAVEGGHLPGRIAVQDALDALLEHRWLVRLDYPDGPVYRTRMAETVRLLARLKQLFPKHLRDRRWQVAPNLVSDYRLAIGLRRFPKRDLHPTRVLQELRQEGNLPPSGEAALSMLLRADQPSPIMMASFQFAATKTILAHLSGHQSTATIVSAGTGSGKTLAFYAPALSHVAAVAGAESFVKALALYPRNELLKDQLSEALKSVRRLNAAVGRAWPRIRVGAYFGETPRRYDSREVAGSRGATGRGWICPFVRCPECGGSLTWLQEDRLAHTEALRCLASGCGAIVSSDDFAWTRQSIQEQPPDVVFTTTEMLNRHMTNSWARHVFGLGTDARRKPRLMLLDEAHTYEGTSGAQAAYLIRRWHHALRGVDRWGGRWGDM